MRTIANNDLFHATWEHLQKDIGAILRYSHTDCDKMTPAQYSEAQESAARAKDRIALIMIMLPVYKPDASSTVPAQQDADTLSNMVKAVGGFKA